MHNKTGCRSLQEAQSLSESLLYANRWTFLLGGWSRLREDLLLQQSTGNVYLPRRQLFTPFSTGLPQGGQPSSTYVHSDDTMCVQRGSTIVVLCGKRNWCTLMRTERERETIGRWFDSVGGEGVFGQRLFPQSRVLSSYLPQNFVRS